MKKSYINDLYNVGKDKYLGYLPIATIISSGYTVSDVERFVKGSSLRMLELHTDCWVFSGAIYVWHEEKLQSFMDSHREYLGGLPTDAEGFVREIAKNTYPVRKYPIIYMFIAECYNNAVYNMEGQANVEVTLRKMGIDYRKYIKSQYE